MRRLVLAGLLAAAVFPAAAQDFLSGSGPRNPVRVDQRLHQQIPLDLQFTDSSGKSVRLGDYFGERPVVLMPVYYSCPMLCGMVLEGSTSTFANIKLGIGSDYDVVTFSFDPRDTTASAAEKRAQYSKRYGRPGPEKGWHFLTGDERSIRALTNAIGFHYEFDEKTGQYAHGAVIVVATPQGKVARYFYGLEVPARDLRLGLVEASEEKIGSLSDAVMLLCYSYNPATGKYAARGMNAVRAGGVATVLGLAAFVFTTIRRERSRHADIMGRDN